MSQTANFLAAKSAKLVFSPLMVDPLMIHLKMFSFITCAKINGSFDASLCKAKKSALYGN